MTVRQNICSRLRRYDASLSSVLLMMILTALGCNTRNDQADDKKESDDTSASSARTPDRSIIVNSTPPAPSSAIPTTPPGKTAVTGEAQPPLRIVSADRSAAFLVGVSLPGPLDSQHHVRELILNPYYNELFACERTYKQEKDNLVYHIHFAIRDSRQIVFKQLKTNPRSEKSQQSADTKTGRCLRGLYQNAIIELSGKLPVTEFVLSFDFQQ